jgi:serine/threonine-protein kinase
LADQLDRLRAALAGRYTIDRPLGQGGMAFVYLAHDVKHEREVAVKVLKPELSATIGAERFLREIRVAAQLQHPNILALYDSGEADGFLYYVMPFVQGESLRDKLNHERQLPIDEAIRFAREAAEGLGYAHGRGVVHRDIKPENILIQGGHALVADFGIAKAVQSASGQKLTETGMAVGTPHYMSPEQSLGGELDGRSDQYSLGCVLYELLIGQAPFDGPNAMAVIARHSLEQVPSLQVVRPSVPDVLEDIVHRTLEKTPADRFSDMAHLVEALSDAEAEAAIQRTSARRAAATPRTPTRVPIETRRTTARIMRPGGTMELPVEAGPDVPAPNPNRRLVVGLATALLFVVLAFGVYALLVRPRGGGGVVASTEADARRVAVLYFQDESPQGELRYLADGLTENLIRELASVQTLSVVSRNGVAPFRGTTAGRDSIARALQVGTLVTGSIEPAGSGKVRVTTRLVDASGTEIARSSFEQPVGGAVEMQDSLASRVAASLRTRLGEEVRVRDQRSRTRSTDAWLALQRAEQARKQAESAIRAGDSAVTEEAFAHADSLARLASSRDPDWNAPTVFLGNIMYRRSRLAVENPVAAGPWIDQGLALANTALGRDNADPDALELRGNLGYWKYLLRLAQGPEADRLLAEARADLEASVRVNPNQAGALGSLSHLYNNDPGTTISDVVLAARRAYEADAYLDNAPTILTRLFYAAYDEDQAVDAVKWCNEGARRFPDDSRFVSCKLWIMTMRGQNADPDSAWKLVRNAAITQDAATGSGAYREHEARMILAAVLARAGLGDSARSVARAARADTDIDPQRSLYDIDAFVQLLAGDKAEALRSLKVYLAANPGRLKDFGSDPGWRFRPLQDDPGFRSMVSTAR